MGDGQFDVPHWRHGCVQTAARAVAAYPASQPECNVPVARWRLAHRCGTDQNSATGGQWWRINHRAAFTTRPARMATRARAWLVPDEHPAGAEPMPAWASLWWPDHP